MEKALKNHRWLVAVSGGPDSMALLDMCRKDGLDIGVAHVNYHHRPTANRDTDIVKKYCRKYKIQCYVLDTDYEVKGNFQSFAREWRYDFFLNTVHKYHYDGVLVAHQQDDVIETYIMQKEKELIPETYGLSSKMIYHKHGEELLVKRPLLKKSKAELLTYCDQNHIPYGIDESNLSNDYTRNKIRHEKVEQMSKEERKFLINEIENKNTQKKELAQKLDNIVDDNCLDLKKYQLLENEERLFLLRLWLKRSKVSTSKNSKKYFKELDQVLLLKKDILLDVGNKQLLKHQQVCEIVGKTDKSYNYKLKSLQALKTPYFYACFDGKSTEAVTIYEDDFPITIRNVEPGDKIKLRIGNKSVHRWFVDRHINLYQRKTWPVVINRNNEIILVPGIGCNVEHYTTKPNMFVIKY